MSTSNVYVLELAGGKVYVGRTDRDVDERFQEHLYDQGSAWTAMHKPIRIVREIQNAPPFEEDRVTKECMQLYGVENVRGGSYANPTLTDGQRGEILRAIRNEKGTCLRCGRAGHWASDCYAATQLDERGNPVGKQLRAQCSRCGRDSHSVDSCYASFHANGKPLKSRYSSRRNADIHWLLFMMAVVVVTGCAILSEHYLQR